MTLINDRIGELEALFVRSAPDSWSVIDRKEKDFDAVLKIHDKQRGRVAWLRFSAEAMEDDLFQDQEAVFTDRGEQWLRAFFLNHIEHLADGTERLIRSGDATRNEK